MKPEIAYPVTPFHINQNFGENLPCVKDYGLPTQTIITSSDNTCPVGYVKLYSLFGMKGHDGTDLMAGIQNVYNSMVGTVIEKQTVASRGLGIGVVSTQPMDLGVHGIHYLKIRYWHLKSFACDVGQNLGVGDLIGISDSTGYSSGNHLHFEGVPMDKDVAGNFVMAFPNNGYAGAIDIAPYFNGKYAQDAMLDVVKNEVQAVATILQNNPTPAQLSLVQRILQKIASFLASFGRGGA